MTMKPIRLALLCTLVVGSSPRSWADDAPARVRSLKVRILSTMLTDNRGLGEWGFAAMVEADGHRILFDTGARPETVLKNARELGVDLAGVTDLILSHHHGDHTGGLLTLRRELRKENEQALTRAYVGKGLFLPRREPGRGETEINETIAMKEPYEAMGGRFVEVDRPTVLFPGAMLTGPVPRRHDEKNWSSRSRIPTEKGMVDDTLPEDMALVLDTEEGLVVVTGCGHAGIVNISEYARDSVRRAPLHAIVGGLHLFPADAKVLDFTARSLREMNLANLLGAHCTGIESVYDLRGRLGLNRSTCVVGAVGASFELGKGIVPGTIAR
ncbi:MAG: MBL fold metallo-hydrolase [Isosphaeraceae bacterium]